MTRASLKLLFLAATISLAACKKDGDDNIFGTDDGQPMTTSGATTTATDATDSIGDETSDSIGDDGATKLDVADGGNSGEVELDFVDAARSFNESRLSRVKAQGRGRRH